MTKLRSVKSGTVMPGVRKKRVLKQDSSYDLEEESIPIRFGVSGRLNNDFLYGHKVQNFMEMDFNEKSYSLCNSCRIPRR